MYLALLLLCLLCFCGPVGWLILFILFLGILVVTESWGWLLFLAIVMILGWVLRGLIDGKKVCRKTSKGKVNTESLEINDANMSLLVRLVGQMPDDGTLISHSKTKGITTAEWDLCLNWFRRNAGEYVDVSICNYTIRVKSKVDKIRLINKLLSMKTNEVAQLLPEDGRWG